MKSLTRQLKRVFGLLTFRDVGESAIRKIASFQKLRASLFFTGGKI
jgi:hypothetical protein